MIRENGWLLALWVLIGMLMAGLTYINPNQFVSIDSQYYLAFAGWLVGLDGTQYGHTVTGWEGTFPLGYPLLIGLTARLTGLSLLVASKLLNWLLVGVFLLIWSRRIGARRTLWVGSLLLLGGYIRILTYTWSEWTFLILLLEWTRLLCQRGDEPMSLPDQWRYAGRLLVLTMALFLLRYVGGYVVVAYALLTLGTYWRSEPTVIRQRIGIDLLYCVGSVAFMLGYFYLNSWLTASAYGGERFVETSETLGHKLGLIGLALLNELLLLRDYVPGEPAGLVLVGVLIQGGLIAWIWPRLRSLHHTLPDWLPADSHWLRMLLASAVTYLTILFVMRLFSPFSGPNPRLMAPATFPLLVLLAVWISRWHNVVGRRRLGYWWLFLLVCSWLQLLPQADLWGKLIHWLNHA